MIPAFGKVILPQNPSTGNGLELHSERGICKVSVLSAVQARAVMINDISVEGWPFKMVTERIKAARRPINLQVPPLHANGETAKFMCKTTTYNVRIEHQMIRN